MINNTCRSFILVKTIILPARISKAVYLLRLSHFGMIPFLYYKCRMQKTLKLYNFNKLSLLIKDLIRKQTLNEQLKKQKQKQRYIPPNTVYGLLLRVPVWWGGSNHAAIVSSRMFKVITKSWGSIRKIFALPFSLRRSFYKRKKKRLLIKRRKRKIRIQWLFSKKKINLLRTSRLSSVALFNTSFFFKRIFNRRVGMYQFIGLSSKVSKTRCINVASHHLSRSWSYGY